MTHVLLPWFQVVQPREDLREARPLDASEFAVELDAIRKGDGPPDYRDPVRFFERTYLTRNLRELGAEVLRRLGGSKVESSAVFSLVTQFGGGKTHAMAMLYHL
jgi:predicted AAA+ superfamily ATPase